MNNPLIKFTVTVESPSEPEALAIIRSDYAAFVQDETTAGLIHRLQVNLMSMYPGFDFVVKINV